MDVIDRGDLPFPQSLPDFQRLFPDDAAGAAYLRTCGRNTGLTVGTVMQRSQTPLGIWFQSA